MNSRKKGITIVAYVSAMGVCGLVLVAIGSTLEFLAAGVSRKSTDIGSVFLARGTGSIIGAISCAKLYRWFLGNSVMTVSLFFLAVVLILLPYCKSTITLHFYFFTLGMGTAITDTGVQLMTRKLHGREAGPWLGLNATIFGLSAALVPVLEIVTTDTIIQYNIMATFVGCIGILMLFTIHMDDYFPDYIAEDDTPLRQQSSVDNLENRITNNDVPHYYTEIVISMMLFCFVGGGVSATAYLESYVDQTKIIDINYKARLIFVLWICITIGRIIGVRDQIALSDFGLYIDLTMFCIGGSISMFFVYMYPESSTALWIGIAFFGFFHGPTVGFCQVVLLFRYCLFIIRFYDLISLYIDFCLLQ